jgi:hypothetical protein
MKMSFKKIALVTVLVLIGAVSGLAIFSYLIIPDNGWTGGRVSRENLDRERELIERGLAEQKKYLEQSQKDDGEQK